MNEDTYIYIIKRNRDQLCQENDLVITEMSHNGERNGEIETSRKVNCKNTKTKLVE